MGDVISKFERGIQRVNSVYGLLLPVTLSIICSTLLWIVSPNYFQPGRGAFYSYIGVSAAVVIVTAIQLLLNKSQSRRLTIWIYIFYHLALTTLSLFVVPHPSPFAFLWLVLMIGVDVLFGRKWQYVTIGYYVVIQIAAYLNSTHSLSFQNNLVAVSLLSGTILVALQVSRYREISDNERVLLDSSSKETSFERQRLLSLINNMGEAVIATDKSGKVLLYNAAVLNLLDTNQSLEGKSLDSLLRLRDKKHTAIKVLSLIKESPVGITSTDYIHEFSKDDVINLYINIAPIKLGFKEKSESGYTIIMRDITREKSLEEERDEFISVVSHELRTPIAIAEGNISNAIFMNKSSKNPTLVDQSLGQAHEQVLFLANMINDLATLSRAERTDSKVDLMDVDPRKLLHDMARDYENQAAAKGLKLTASAASNTKPIYTSELYLHEILQNFVTNSIKYTKKGGLVLHVRSNKSGDAVFSVADTGIGLSKADQKRVFDKFFRSEDFRTRESSGTGLGLYVTAKIAHKLGAQIGLESELNKGSTFTITVPSKPRPQKRAA